MNLFLIGRYFLNAGPCNVNKNLIDCSDSDLIYIKSKNKVAIVLEIFFKLFRSDVIIESGFNSKIIWRLVKPFLKKRKLIVLMHGYSAYENVINELHLKKSVIDAEKLFLENADLILCVSKKHSEWFKRKCPQLADKVSYLNNGVKICPRKKTPKEPFSIAVAGGNRRIKNNIEVCRAVEKLIAEGLPCKLYVFGRIYEHNDDILDFPFLNYMGHLEKNEYYDKLDSISCFVMNSELEPFGLVIADAINCNCSLLLSSEVGASEIIETTDDDVIYDPHNIDELSEKIGKVLRFSNAYRILSSIDVEEVSEERAYEKLKKISMDLMSK